MSYCGVKQMRLDRHSINKMSHFEYLLLLILLFLLAGCPSDSGAPNTNNLNQDIVGGEALISVQQVSYTGPVPQSVDVQNFKRFFWDPITGQGYDSDKCSSCHGAGGDAPSKFARVDDVNMAFQVASVGIAENSNPLVNFSEPENSEFVIRVANGHNCWEENNSICRAAMIAYIEGWRDGASPEATQLALTAPLLQDPSGSKPFPETSSAFASTLWPVLKTTSDPISHCQGCHSDTASLQLRQSPYFASEDVDLAYEEAKSKINLITPENSRFVEKVGEESHNCWSDCASNAAEILGAIEALANPIVIENVDPDLVISKALRLYQDGIVASSGGRIEADVIALYEFKEGAGTVAEDTSGVLPKADLTLSGDADEYHWLSAWGVRFNGGKAQASVSSSKKLHDLISETGEYAVEAWLAASNVTQEGPARIIAYSGGSEHNFILGQTLYNYNAIGRTSNTDAQGMPMLSTADADEDLQATLQHVVVNYDPLYGRRIYVNGVYTGDSDAVQPGHLMNWDDTFPLVLGSNIDGSDPWSGSVRMLAIHNRALSPANIQINFDAGVGQKYLLLFSVSHLLDTTTDAFIIFEVSQFDNYAYLFNQPYFLSLDPNVTPETVAVEGMRIGINGKLASTGQAFATLSTTVRQSDYDSSTGQQLSPFGTIIALEEGPDLDQFFLSFDRFGNHTEVFVDATPPDPVFTGSGETNPLIAVRNFAEIHHSFAQITGVPTNHSSVASTYDTVIQQLPSNEAMAGFLSSHQMGVAQLAISYCDALIENKVFRDALGISLDEVDAPNVDDANAKTVADWDSDFVDPFITASMNSNLTEQPLATDTKAILHHLLFTDGDGIAEIDAANNPQPHGLSRCLGGCPDGQTANAAKAACAAVLGSAAVTFH